MNLGAYQLANKKAITFNMAGRDSAYEKMLEGLSIKELTILRKHSGLIDRLREIAKMTLVQVLAELREEYNLEIDQYNNTDMFISTEKLEDAIPDWFTTSHCGWYKSPKDGELEEWGKELLMQEVRINIWIKYLEHNKEPKPKIFCGQYL